MKAKKIIVDTIGTARNGKAKPYLPSVGKIDRTLKVSFDLPALTQDGSAGGAADSTSLCGRTWTCAKQQFDVCPGMRVTTGQVRGFTTEAKLLSKTMYKPTFGFLATKGKKYSMLFVDLMQPAFAALGMTESLHYSAFNVDNAAALNALTGSSEGQEFGPWLAPGNPMEGANTYVHMLFEHNAALSFNHTKAKGLAGARPFNLTAFLEATKLNTATLVAANWFNAVGSVASREQMISRYGAMAKQSLGMFKGACTDMMPCRSCTGTLDMCNAMWKPADCKGTALIPTKQTNCTAAKAPVENKKTTITTTTTRTTAGPTVVNGKIKFGVSMNALAADTFVKDAKVVLGVEKGIASKLNLIVSWVKATLAVEVPAGRRLAAHAVKTNIGVDFKITVPASATSAPSASKLETSLKNSTKAAKDEWAEKLTTAIKQEAPAHKDLNVTVMSIAHSPPQSPTASSGQSAGSTSQTGDITSASVLASVPVLGCFLVMMVATFI